MIPRKHAACDAVIFDIDNVLIDTRKSYLEAIRWTVEFYLTDGKIPLFKRDFATNKMTVLSPQHIHQLKLLGGFNDDWDCCYGLLIYLLSLPVEKRTATELRKKIDLEGFAKKISLRPLGVPLIASLLGRPKSVTVEKISRIFQEIYLGKDLFKTVEKKKAVYWKKQGLIRREKLVFKKRLLEKLKEAGLKLGIATGRSRFEASFGLKQLGIQDLFDAVTTADEIRKAEKTMRRSLRKPHPFSVIETANALGKNLRFMYIGDLPDDVLAANQAKESVKIESVAFPLLSTEAPSAIEEIQKSQPDYILKKPADILKLLKI